MANPAACSRGILGGLERNPSVDALLFLTSMQRRRRWTSSEGVRAPTLTKSAYYYGSAGRERKTTAGCGDLFAVDELLVLPYDEEEEEEKTGEFCPFRTISGLTCTDEFCAVRPTGGAGLEWLSNYKGDDAFSTEDLQRLQLINGIPAGGFSSVEKVPPAALTAAAAKQQQQQPGMFMPEGPVPTKARSNRPRAAPVNWTSRMFVLAAVPGVHAHLTGSEPGILAHAFPAKKLSKPSKKKNPRTSPAGAVLDGVRGGAMVPALRDGQDAAVEDGPQHAVQHVRGAVQVGPTGAGIPPGGEPRG
ncbi:hypothetical protein PR202_gb02852 [Eleusine coracana subsp. coracana]|uniref:Uncharacterized protein n=1 Tax=Eleusine coracana subsp. coracana TaxID=191504 RepID=A0AAV5E0B1_ELECO|nr:hypothetical protein PR202_gb02852 [Eleusine coracana subsp. coracana]